MSRLSIPSMLNDAPPSRAPAPFIHRRALMPPPTCVLSSGLSRGFNLTLVPFWSRLTPTYTSNTYLLPRSPPAPLVPPTLPFLPLNGGRTAEYGVHVSPRSHLSVLYRYQPGVDLEYPESGANAPVGHLIPMDPAAKQLPWVDFAYSRGTPDGGCAKDDFFFSDLLVDANGKPVPCKKRHTTCQGVKACPFSDTQALTGPAHCHTSATRQDIENRLTAARDARQRLSTPQRDIFIKTAAYITAVRTLGCRRPLQQETRRTGEELLQFEQEQSQQEHFRRGYSTPQTCQGRIRYHEYPDPFDKDAGLRAYLRSVPPVPEPRPSLITPTAHTRRWLHVDYIAAHFLSNTDELQRIEQAAATQDLGPLAFCNTLRNFSAQTLHCPVDHRVEGRLAQVELCHLDCDVKFRILFPVDLQKCPFVLVTSKGVHRHPIPLPEKTPQALRNHLLGLLRTLRQDLPDMTPRRFLRHPALKVFLINTFPHLAMPTLSALHPSLANRAHLGAYIALVREEHFPHGTDWKGILHLKRLQDDTLAPHQHYIRVILELDNATLPVHEEDDDPPPATDNKTRIIVCFKRIVGFDEFEIAGMDRDANTSIVFCRVYLTRHTAAAHQQIFQEINQIVHHDTGRPLYWRHIHGRSPNDFRVGLILHWGADQHRGQAKGLGLHLADRASELPLNTMDMHEPDRSLHDLTPYDHLRRVYRVCRVHNFRNIQHSAADWVRDKESCQFAFSGICWERSFIPLPVWEAGDPHTNLIETVHRDVNREGVHCTLLGGLLRGQDYDELQRATLLEFEQHGIRPSYHPLTPSRTPSKMLSVEVDNGQAKKVQSTALAVSTHNSNMQKFDEKLAKLWAASTNSKRSSMLPIFRQAERRRRSNANSEPPPTPRAQCRSNTTSKSRLVWACAPRAATESASLVIRTLY
ncbi:hypothetical protein B0H13DRAFT_2373213 [Mycena leptocephala]|nr:hypothetical protein B0H13DRAFT_2373213 [Mycena leptocephala]